MSSPARAARDARRELARLARPAGAFDARRYFRDADNLAFHNIGTERVRALAKTIVRVHRETWTLGDVVSFADLLITDRHLEAKALGVEALACYRQVFTTGLLATWKRWLATDRAANWATTDAICGLLIGPLVVANPRLVRDLSHWSRDRNLWVRRASAVSLVPLVRKGLALDEAYALADGLHADREDLIQKVVGWMLREAGKADPDRLRRYLRANGPKIPRTTVRYAIERFSRSDRRELLVDTRCQSQPSRDQDSKYGA